MMSQHKIENFQDDLIDAIDDQGDMRNSRDEIREGYILVEITHGVDDDTVAFSEDIEKIRRIRDFRAVEQGSDCRHSIKIVRCI